MELKSAPNPPPDAPKFSSLKTDAGATFAPPSTEVERIHRHLRAAQFAFDAYLTEETLKGQFSHPSFEFYEENGFAFFAVMLDGETAAIAFRGTQPKHSSNLWADANCLLTGTPKRHKGFMGVWSQLKTAVVRWLLKHQPLRIVLSGHSLGGALAVLAAYDLAAGWTIEEVTVFGCPRVGTPGFASDYASRKSGANNSLGDVTTRYVHSTDVVSRIPPPWFWYKHVGHPVNVNEEGARIYYPSSYIVRVLELALDPTTSQTSGYDYKTIRSSTQIRQPDVSVLSMFRRAIIPVVSHGLVPLWALCVVVVALSIRFVWRDIDYFHDSERYTNVILKRQLLIESSPLWHRSQI